MSEDQRLSLTEEITKKEVKFIIWEGNEGRALGLDGFTLSFFKAAWEIVGKDVIQVVQHFFNSSRLLREINSTFISLIPKSDDVVSFNDYKPISLCNLIYKFIPKS